MVEQYRAELEARRDLFYAGIETLGGILTGRPPSGAFYAFLRVRSGLEETAKARRGHRGSRFGSAREVRVLGAGRVPDSARDGFGCIPGADFGPAGEGYLRFCFARDRAELDGALDSLRALFA